MLESIRSSVEIELTFMVTRTYVSSIRQLSLVGLMWRYHGVPAKLQHFQREAQIPTDGRENHLRFKLAPLEQTGN